MDAFASLISIYRVLGFFIKAIPTTFQPNPYSTLFSIDPLFNTVFK
jgi:hypothetical protein